MENESFTKEVVRRLGNHLKSLMPELAQVVEEFPESNQQLKYPCLSIITAGDPTHTPCDPYLLRKKDAISNKASVLYVSGSYDLTLQLDFWAASKEQRSKIYDSFYKAFNSQWPVMGLSLILENYYNTIGRYDLTSYRFNDGEESSQRKEWRAKVKIIVTAKAVLERKEFIIAETELQTDISEVITIPEGV